MSQDHILYKNAPIAEALIDLHVTADDSINLTQCTKQFTDKLCKKFPISKKIKSNEFKIEMPDSEAFQSPQIETTHSDIGVRLDNKQSNKVLQARGNGFTLSYVNMYTSWEEFSAEAKLYWKEYLNIFKPKTVTRVAVRYINKLDLPGPKAEPSDYFNLYPKLPQAIPQDIDDFLLRLIMPQADIESTAIINQATMPPSDGKHISVALDFDIFKNTNLVADNDEIWNLLDILRIRKNLLFESCITEKTRKAIK